LLPTLSRLIAEVLKTFTSPVKVSPALFAGVKARASVTSVEVRVTAPVRVLKLATPDPVPVTSMTVSVPETFFLRYSLPS
jgi:hypothetical protein